MSDIAQATIQSTPKTEATVEFSTFNFPAEIVEALAEGNFVTATPVQAKAIPILSEGKDILATAQTGTGKTLAFALPIVAKIMEDSHSSVLVLVPTRELAQQVLKTFQMLTRKTRVKSVLLIGGAYMRAQCQDLAKKPRIIVGTPGRIIDHLMRKTFNPQGIRHVVLDEMDRMLDMGFGEQLSEIFGFIGDQPRQTAMFSATLPAHISRLASRYLTDPVKISIGSHSQPVAKIKQEVVFIKQSEKQAKLLAVLKERAEKTDQGTCIIFVKTKVDCGDIAELLLDHGFKAAAMHGDLNQSKRQRVLQDFRTQKVEILVATDIAARGIDVAHIRLVINYELPQAAEDYVHRIGRTARGGAEGVSISFVASFENKKWVEILRLTNPEQAKAFQQKMGHQGGGKPSGSRFGGGGYGGGRSEGGRSEGRGGFGGGRSEGRGGFGGGRSEGGRSFGNRDESAPRRFERPEGTRTEGARSEGRGGFGGGFSGGRSEGRSEGRGGFGGGRSEGGRSEGRGGFGGGRSEGGRSEGRGGFGGGRSEGGRSEGRGGDFAWKKPSTDGRSFSDRTSRNSSSSRSDRAPSRSFSVMEGQVSGK